MSDALTSREEKFCELVAGGESPVTAVAKAGYENKAPAVYANKLMKKGKIQSRITLLKRTALAGVIVPGAADVVLSRQYLIQRLVDMQHGYRDTVALTAVVKLGQEEFDMFAEKIATIDPALKSTEQLNREDQVMRKKLGLMK